MRVVLVRTDDEDTRAGVHDVFTPERLPCSWRYSTIAAPLCDPSRMCVHTGRHAHNHGLRTNGPPIHYPDNLAKWLQDAGVHTAHVGKWTTVSFSPTDYGPGWSEYRSTQQGRYYDFLTSRSSGPGLLITGQYHTDWVFQQAAQILGGTSGPIFLVVDLTAPHRSLNPAGNPIPAPRHLGSLDSWTPSWPPNFTLTGQEEQDAVFLARRRGECLMAVDEGVKLLTDVDPDAVMMRTSDNGLMMGSHGLLVVKNVPWREAFEVPLRARGPMFTAGETINRIVSNVDLAPTILELFQVSTPSGVILDGESLLQPTSRGYALVRGWNAPGGQCRTFSLIFSKRRTYILRHEGGTLDEQGCPLGTSEVSYDLIQDPYQMSPKTPTQAERDELDMLVGCSGGACL